MTVNPIALDSCTLGSDMNWLRKMFDQRSEAPTPGESALVRLADAGAEVVLFIPGCTADCICEAARLLEGGRIPLTLAEPPPLNECSNHDGCICRYEAWPNSVCAKATS